MNGHALLFNPPPIHKSNFVLFPNYLQYSRLKNFCKALEGKFTTNHDGLVTIMNDLVEFHYNIYNQHLEILELTLEPLSVNDAKRCLDFLKYESYLLQKPIYLSIKGPNGIDFYKEQGFRHLMNEEEREEIYQGFWEPQIQKQKA